MSLDTRTELKNHVFYSLGPKEIKKYFTKLGIKCPIILYKDFHKYKDISQLFKKGDDAFIILYLSSKYSGHYALVFKRKSNEIECFDSLAFKPDDELHFIPKNIQDELNENKDY